MARKYTALLAFVVMVSSSAPLVRPAVSRAEHEVYYRYTVLGYVKDAKGGPRRGVPVELVRDRTGFSYLGETDETGLYVITARIGDESVGEKLSLRAGGRATSVTIRFEPADHLRERGTRVDFLGDRPVETATAFAATLQKFLGR